MIFFSYSSGQATYHIPVVTPVVALHDELVGPGHQGKPVPVKKKNIGQNERIALGPKLRSCAGLMVHFCRRFDGTPKLSLTDLV